MHIWILTQFYPPEFGAAAIRLSRLARLLAADGHRATVLTGMPNYPEGVIRPEYRGRVFCNEMLDGVKVERVWVYASPSKRARTRLLNQFSFMAMAALRGTFLKRPDVILVESHPLFVTLTGGWLRRIKRAPVILNVSDLWPESAVATGALRPDSLLVKLAAPVERWAYRDAAHIVGMTDGVLEGILRILPDQARVSLIKNAVDLAVFHPDQVELRTAVRARYGLGERFTAVHMGNMSLTYDFDILLDAAAALPEIAFLFVGGGSQAAHVEEQVRECGLSNVQLAGVLPHEQMPGIWAAGDVALIALGDHSVAGGTRPAKLYEALATGTPVVAAIRGEGAALIEDAQAGIVVPIGDSEAMIAALQRLKDSPELRGQMSAAGRAYAEASLSPEPVKRAYVEIFGRVLKAQKSSN
jgi:putative colanic acid biosynthesis glycosyltransferase WcaI